MKLLKLLWGRSKKKERGVRGWWGKKKERKKKEKRSGSWVVGTKKKKKEVGDMQRNSGRWKRKMGKEGILGVEKVIKKKIMNI